MYKLTKYSEVIILAMLLACVIFIPSTTMEKISLVSNVICVLLVTKGRIENYYFGLIGVLSYGYVAYTNMFYGDVMLNLLYYFPMQIFGFIKWRKMLAETNSTQVEAKTLTKKELGLIILGSAVSILIYSIVLQRLGGSKPTLDATSTILSIVAMMLMAYGYVEQWYLWILVNIVSMLMWYNGINTSLLMWTMFLMNSVTGLIRWKYMENKNK